MAREKTHILSESDSLPPFLLTCIRAWSRFELKIFKSYSNKNVSSVSCLILYICISFKLENENLNFFCSNRDHVTFKKQDPLCVGMIKNPYPLILQ